MLAAEGGKFAFEPDVVKKRRKRPLSQKTDKSKKKWESDHATLHELANIMSDNPKKEDLRAISLQEFITNIERRPQRKRIPAPAEAHSLAYDAILYLKGLPYEATEDDVMAWLDGYEVINVVLIKNESGCFTGDAYVRCSSVAERDRVHREMSNKYLGARYIQMFRLMEAAYIEYYNTGYRREPSERNYISPNFLVMKNSNKIKPVDLTNLKTGARISGAVSEIYRNGILVDCGVYEVVGAIKERVFCVLMRNRIAKNVGMVGQQKEWLKKKDIVLFPGIKLNLYVEKVRMTTAQTSFDEDLWREHFGEPFQSLNVESELPKRSMVYLTMDSSVSEDKVKWWERRLADSYAKFIIKDEKEVEKVEDEEAFQKVAVGVDWLGGRPSVKASEVVAGKVTLVGNKRLTEKTTSFTFQAEESPEEDDDKAPYHELVREFMRGSDVDKYGTYYHGFDDPDGYREPGEERPSKPKVEEDDIYDEIKEDYSQPQLDPNMKTLEDVRRRTIAEEFKAFPRTSLYDQCIQLPNTGWLLRLSDVPNLSAIHVTSLLRQLGKAPLSGTKNADFENRMMLCKVIKEQGLGTGLDPKTLIAKGLYKVKQSKKKMKRIIELTKNLTGRKFTREDLDAASKAELEMLADESLKKFSEWDPPDLVKKTFVDMYGNMLGDDTKDQSINEQWDALKWHIVIKIYGEQSHIKEIVRDIEANDRLLGNKPGSSTESIEEMVNRSLRETPLEMVSADDKRDM
ncbi:hypothetical protein BgAZ_101430 [Babesia gibsoni]|uniref:RRM domain-containing protein n=1 Tax=Babesia gibsoni TaxID=33632 RepID=A0AAD8UTI2_BABGI|nr:hypothetical protein BgAZ_101430 [Babesia gibsoni]